MKQGENIELLKKMFLDNLEKDYVNIRLKSQVDFWKGLAIVTWISYISYLLIDIFLGK